MGFNSSSWPEMSCFRHKQVVTTKRVPTKSLGYNMYASSLSAARASNADAEQMTPRQLLFVLRATVSLPHSFRYGRSTKASRLGIVVVVGAGAGDVTLRALRSLLDSGQKQLRWNASGSGEAEDSVHRRGVNTRVESSIALSHTCPSKNAVAGSVSRAPRGSSEEPESGVERASAAPQRSEERKRVPNTPEYMYTS